MDKVLLSTVEEYGFYNYILNAVKIHADKKLKKNFTIKKLKLISPSINFFFFIIKNLFLGVFFDKQKLLKLSYKNCNIGKYISSALYRDTSSHKSLFILYINIFKYLYIAGKIFNTAIKISNDNQAFYIDHAGYLNGIFYEILSKKKKLIYSNVYPRGVFFIDFRKKENFFFQKVENLLRLRKLKKLTNKKREKNINFFEKILKKPETIPYMKSTKFNKIKRFNLITNNINKFEYIIYAHSFTDAQLWYGHDGFVTLYDWLDFTIKELKEKNVSVLVKGHPNFYNKSIGLMSKIDKEKFTYLSKKYNSAKIFFLNTPIKNGELLKKINKKTILISHHGTALLEGLYSGFKCISSIATFWDPQIKITNQWKSTNEYRLLLNKDWSKLKYPNKNHLLNIIYQVFLDDNSAYGKNYYLEIFSKISKITRERMFRLQHNLKVNKKIEIKIINKISQNIEEINY
jgi:hypothetical protein